MLAQFPEQPDQAVAAAVYLHGLAGETRRAGAGREVPDRHRPAALSSRRHGGVCRRIAPRLKRRPSRSASGSRGELPRRGVVLLIGNLGAGKTTLAKGIVSGLGAAEPDEVSSPTFTLIHEYGGGSVYHIDLYRLDEAREVATLGLDELFDRDALVLIEWGERFPQLMPAERTEIRIRDRGRRRKGNRSHDKLDMSSKQTAWALILGASSGFGEATALELARAGMNIFGVHMDRRDKLPHVAEVQERIRALGRECEFFNCNAADEEKRQETASSRSAQRLGAIRRGRCAC